MEQFVLLSLLDEVEFDEEQVNPNSDRVNTETEVEEVRRLLDEVVLFVGLEGIEVVLTRLLQLPVESFSRFLTFFADGNSYG